MTTPLQKDVLDVLDINGRMQFIEVLLACRVPRKKRGGFRHSVNRLFAKGFVDSDENEMWITAAGVHEVERVNLAADRRNHKRSADN